MFHTVTRRTRYDWKKRVRVLFFVFFIVFYCFLLFFTFALQGFFIFFFFLIFPLFSVSTVLLINIFIFTILINRYVRSGRYICFQDAFNTIPPPPPQQQQQQQQQQPPPTGTSSSSSSSSSPLVSPVFQVGRVKASKGGKGGGYVAAMTCETHQGIRLWKRYLGHDYITGNIENWWKLMKIDENWWNLMKLVFHRFFFFFDYLLNVSVFNY